MNTLPTTQRGFVRLEFSDASDVTCSLQESSNAMQPCIWLGCNDANPMVLEPGKGWQPVPMPEDYLANTRMQLNRQMVSWLLPYLQHFAATGRLEQPEAGDEPPCIIESTQRKGEIARQLNLGVAMLQAQIKAGSLEEELRDMQAELHETRCTLWAVLKAAGPVNIPRALISKRPSAEATVTKLQLPDGSVTMQAD